MRGRAPSARFSAGCRRRRPGRRATAPARVRGSGFAQSADGLHPAEALLDPFAQPLTDRITRMPGGAGVERGTPRPRVILGHVRGDLEGAARPDEAVRIEAL